MNKLQHCIISAIIISLCACSPVPHEENNNNNATSEIAEPVRFMALENGEHNNFGNEQPQAITISDEKTWQDFWHKLHGNINPMPPLPDINFNDEMVLAILDAPRSTPAMSFAVESLSKTKTELIVNVIREEPGKSCMMAQVVSEPYIILRTQSAVEKVVLNIVPKITECE
jgi:hypothetical protein